MVLQPDSQQCHRKLCEQATVKLENRRATGSPVAADSEMGAGGQKGAVLRNAAPVEPMVLPPVASSHDLDADPEV